MVRSYPPFITNMSKSKSLRPCFSHIATRFGSSLKTPVAPETQSFGGCCRLLGRHRAARWVGMWYRSARLPQRFRGKKTCQGQHQKNPTIQPCHFVHPLTHSVLITDYI